MSGRRAAQRTGARSVARARRDLGLWMVDLRKLRRKWPSAGRYMPAQRGSIVGAVSFACLLMNVPTTFDILGAFVVQRSVASHEDPYRASFPVPCRPFSLRSVVMARRLISPSLRTRAVVASCPDDKPMKRKSGYEPKSPDALPAAAPSRHQASACCCPVVAPFCSCAATVDAPDVLFNNRQHM